MAVCVRSSVQQPKQQPEPQPEQQPEQQAEQQPEQQPEHFKLNILSGIATSGVVASVDGLENAQRKNRNCFFSLPKFEKWQIYFR